MPEFHTVVDEFDNLINKFDFKCPKKLWYNHLVVLSKHLGDIYYCYVIARVHKNDGSLETTLWIGPINRPDDGLDNLSANIKLQIGFSQTLDDSFFKDCESKIITLIEEGALEPLLSASKRELAFPSVNNRRHEVYTKFILPFFQQVVQKANNDIKILSSRKKCEPIIEIVFSDDKDEKMRDFFDKLGLKATIDKIWELCYLFSIA